MRKGKWFDGIAVLILFVVAILVTGCASTMELGKGGSMVTGAAGNSGTQGESKQLAKCDRVIATVEIDEPTAGAETTSWIMISQQLGLPGDTRPLLKLIMAQTGCFKIVDRAAGLRAAKREHELAEAGLTRKGSSVKKGNVIEAQYTLVPKVVVSQKNSSARSIGGLAAFIPIPGASIVGALAGGITSKTSDAQVTLEVINNDTLVQEGIAEGSAQSRDIGFGAGILGVGTGGLGGVGGGAWSKTDQGKVVAAAFMDATNKLVPFLKDLDVPQSSAGTVEAKEVKK